MSEENVYKAEEATKLNVQSSLPAFALIGVGTAFLLANLFDIRLMDFFWPAFVIAPGLLLMWPAYKSTADEQSKFAFLAVPGAMIATTGALLFAMNLTNHFEAWSYCWLMVIASAAGGVMYVTRYDDNARLQVRVHKFIKLLSMAFIGLAFFFEIIVFENFNPLMSLGLIGFGLYLLLRNKRVVKTA
jgi:hypothetical protein